MEYTVIRAYGTSQVPHRFLCSELRGCAEASGLCKDVPAYVACRDAWLYTYPCLCHCVLSISSVLEIERVVRRATSPRFMCRSYNLYGTVILFWCGGAERKNIDGCSFVVRL